MSDITRTGLDSSVSSSDSLAGFAIDPCVEGGRLAFAQLPGSSRASSEPQGIRMDRVMRVRAQILAGTYDTPEKLDAAIDRMLSRAW